MGTRTAKKGGQSMPGAIVVITTAMTTFSIAVTVSSVHDHLFGLEIFSRSAHPLTEIELFIMHLNFGEAQLRKLFFEGLYHGQRSAQVNIIAGDVPASIFYDVVDC